MKITLKTNFDIENAIKSLNENAQKFVNEVAEEFKKGTDSHIKTGAFKPLKESTKKLHGSHLPLHLTGKLAKSNKLFPAKGKSLIARVKNTAKSTKSYRVFKNNGKVYRGKRNKTGEFYGYYQNKGFKTAPDSLIPNKTVPARTFFEVDEDKLFLKYKFDKFTERVNKSFKFYKRMVR